MHVHCLSTRAADLPASVRAYERVADDFVYWGVEAGRSYVVYAIEWCNGHMCVRVNAETLTFPIELFQVSDPRASRYWHVVPVDPDLCMIGFEGYASNDYRLGLIDGTADALATFERYRILMDREYPDPRIHLRAKILKDMWVQCPVCEDGWQTTPEFGMIECPKCAGVVHNPLYRSID